MEGVHGGVGDCWKRLRVGRTSKCFWNWEVGQGPKNAEGV